MLYTRFFQHSPQVEYFLHRRVREGAGKMDAAVGRFEANEAAVFGRMDLFAKRCRKLIELFTTIHQFSELAKVCTSDSLPK